MFTFFFEVLNIQGEAHSSTPVEHFCGTQAHVTEPHTHPILT